MAGATISGWSEGILLSLAFVAILGLVIAGFNLMYNQNNSLGLSDNTTEQYFIEYQQTAQEQIEGGEVQFDAQQGITLKSSYGITIDAIKITWGFINGGWIEKLATMWNIGEAGMLFARAMRIIWFLSLVFGLLYALFKVVL